MEGQLSGHSAMLGPIPSWYHVGMTTQIAVRLPDDVVSWVDAQVSNGTAPSRAAVVAHALEQEWRRTLAERDAQILRQGHDDDLGDLADWNAQNFSIEGTES